MPRKRRSIAVLHGGKAKPTQRERTLQKQCCVLYTQGQGHHTSLLFAVPNGELRDKVVAGQLSGISGDHRARLPPVDRLAPYGLGVVPGVADLILLTPPASRLRRMAERLARWAGLKLFLGQTTLIELKAPEDVVRELKEGTQSTQQKLFMLATRAMDFDYRLITTEQDFYDLLIEKGVKLRVGRPLQIRYAAPITAAAPHGVAPPPRPARRRAPQAA